MAKSIKLARPALAVAGAIGLLASAEGAQAAACATVSFSPASISVPAWNPIAPAPSQANVTATITRSNSTTTSVRLILLDSNERAQPVRLGTASDGASGPIYQVLDASGTNILYPLNTSVTASNAPLVNYPSKGGGNALSLSLRLLVPANSANADFRNGTYGETLNYAVQCLANGNKANGTDGPVAGPATSLTIPNLVSLTSASAATIDFQSFTTLTQPLNIGLKSTGPVSVAIRSDNGLKMVRSGAALPLADNSQIKYFMTLRDVAINRTPLTLTNQPRAGVGGTSWPLVLSLPEQPRGKVAGTYTDVIVLTLTAGS